MKTRYAHMEKVLGVAAAEGPPVGGCALNHSHGPLESLRDEERSLLYNFSLVNFKIWRTQKPSSACSTIRTSSEPFSLHANGTINRHTHEVLPHSGLLPLLPLVDDATYQKCLNHQSISCLCMRSVKRYCCTGTAEQYELNAADLCINISIERKPGRPLATRTANVGRLAGRQCL